MRTNPDGTMEDALARSSDQVSALVRQRQALHETVKARHAEAVAKAAEYDSIGNVMGAAVWTGRYIELAAVLRVMRE